MEERYKFFCKLMKCLDEAEGERTLGTGSFGFLKEGYYVRNLICSCGEKTSIVGLKKLLAMDVLEMYKTEAINKKSNITYKEIEAVLSGTARKKYSFNYCVLDECIDEERNRREMLMNMHMPGAEEQLRMYVEELEICFPYLFMDRLRADVWSKLGEFFKLCRQETCMECVGKQKAYFKFVQTAALYEIFYGELVYKNMQEYVSCLRSLDRKMEDNMEKQYVSLMNEFYLVLKKISVYYNLELEFGTSLNAMYYVLTILEGMILSGIEVGTEETFSQKLIDKLWAQYGKDMAIKYCYNQKKRKRYMEVNEILEDLIKQSNEHEYGKLDHAAVFSLFIDELCKPVRRQDKELLRALESVLGCPFYYRSTGGEECGGDNEVNWYMVNRSNHTKEDMDMAQVPKICPNADICVEGKTLLKPGKWVVRCRANNGQAIADNVACQMCMSSSGSFGQTCNAYSGSWRNKTVDESKAAWKKCRYASLVYGW